MLVMVVFFIAFRWIHLSTPLIRLFLLVLILLLMPTLIFLPVWFALSLLGFHLPSHRLWCFSFGLLPCLWFIFRQRPVCFLRPFPFRRPLRLMLFPCLVLPFRF